MRIPRCFIDQPLQTGEEIALDERAHRHVVQVLRLRVGAPLILFNGEGGEYAVTLTQAERRASRVHIDEHRPRDTRPALRVTLLQGIAKGDRMDYSLQKATELGVSRIQPLVARRSVTHDDPKRMQKRLDHWRGVIISACEQSGRTDIPKLLPPLPLSQWLDERPGREAQEVASWSLVLDPEATSGLGDLAASRDQPRAVTLLIGPEGGLEEGEIAQARHCGLSPVRLGPRVLRTETAGVAALAIIQSLWGDMG
ncbi:16S rRNA (uracil(1498)-N(3))-methyltransferase [Ectothiorhodospira variabilis]|uniref:16S rRNA (uracil(1498)-N(3))-methyltransferase n=1 Tax=Ectothiorhodospira variabilis TaxID=505694 RepID=UPI001EFADA0E|nr:16S rRNA (uracil(1498)-N(3))-methyltransferase [Ectothiorhodospira variabilis]MCG5494606.1 16S rRNA (uracil(1498)-N(3))-methyltransferase [Ectothiorhodospira variabilis]MCG5503597.1 16S rRNA (uracil(1498)-N(3))-methyltransferase [Ectothiorhodospira variabilis]MCG5506688.1 16S rRNA (uracil(1498)-N(3))-methyltransferase [Ectothiorhodospira variabilis]